MPKKKSTAELKAELLEQVQILEEREEQEKIKKDQEEKDRLEQEAAIKSISQMGQPDPAPINIPDSVDLKPINRKLNLIFGITIANLLLIIFWIILLFSI